MLVADFAIDSGGVTILALFFDLNTGNIVTVKYEYDQPETLPSTCSK